MQNAPTVTIQEVLQLALPPGSDVLATEGQLQRRVTWARLLRARPTGLRSVEPGELLLLSNSLLEPPQEPRVIGRLLAELIDAGVAAFLVAGSGLAAVERVCAERDTPLLRVPADATLAEVERAIASLILDREGQLRRRADEVYGRLLTSMLNNAGLSALVAALAQETGLRAAVFDDYFALRASAPDDPPFEEALAESGASLLTRDASNGAGRLGRTLPIRVERDKLVWIGQLHPLQIGSAWAGYLGLLGRPGETGELDRLLADRASTLVALELAKERAVAQATQRWRGELLDDLLDGSYPSEEAVLARGHQLGYDLARPHLAFVFQAGSSAAPGSPPDNPLSRQRRRFATVARAAVQRLEPRALAVEREGGLLCLLPLGRSQEPAEAAGLVERIRAAVEEALPGLAIAAGTGRVTSQPREVPTALEQAQQAASIGLKLLGRAQTIGYDQLGVERLLYHLLGNPALEHFALDVLGDLIAHDAQQRSDLVHTLEVFLACNGNHVRAAQELHLHRNTLLYRLERAREILGRDLEDADERLALQVALRIRGALQPRPAEEPVPRRRVAGRRRRAG